jgi:ABC-2 type transport system permease protein
MRPILVLVKKDFLLFRRDRASLLLTFVVPFALIYLFGQIFGIHRSNSGFGTAQLIGGWAVQFLLFALVSSATALFYEKDHGVFQRILSGPVPRSTILWSKFLYGAALGLGQLLLLFAAGSLLFGLTLGPRLPFLLPVCLFAAAACAAFGMLLASLARTPESARGMSTFVILLMSALGGAWFPIGLMPQAMQHLSRLTLVYWAVTGFGQAFSPHPSWVQLLPILAALAAMTAAILAVAGWRFQRGTIFD